MSSMNKSNQRLTRRSDIFAIDKEVFDFCLMEVQKIEYNFPTLKSNIVSFALEKKFSSFNIINGRDIVNVVEVIFENNDHLLEIEVKIKDTFPLFQEVVLLELLSKSVKKANLN